MISFKKLTSIVLSGLMLFPFASKIFAKERVQGPDVLVMGDYASKQKFIKTMFDEEVQKEALEKISQNSSGNGFEGQYQSEQTETSFGYYKTANIDISKFEPNDKNRKKFTDTFINSYQVVIATIDMDQETEKAKEDISNIINYICKVKNDFTTIMVVGLCDNNSTNETDKTIEETVKNIHLNQDRKQFKHEFLFSTKSDKKSIDENIGHCGSWYYLELSHVFREHKFETIAKIHWFSVLHPTATKITKDVGIGTVAIGTVAGACYGLYKGGKCLYNKYIKPKAETAKNIMHKS